MGQAKQRGTYEERKAEAVAKREVIEAERQREREERRRHRAANARQPNKHMKHALLSAWLAAGTGAIAITHAEDA